MPVGQICQDSARTECILPLGGERLGMRETEVTRRLKLTQPTACISVRRGEHIAREKGLNILGKYLFIF